MQFDHSSLYTPIEYLKGVGPAKGKLLKEELGIATFTDLLHYFPFRYIDKSQTIAIRDINKEDEYVLLIGKISSIELQGFKGKSRLTATFTDQTGSVQLIWFQGANYIQNSLDTNKTYKAYGKISFYKGSRTIAHPELEEVDHNKPIKVVFEPIYSSTEKLRKKGLDSRGILKLMKELFTKLKPAFLPEFFPQETLSYCKLVGRAHLFRIIHFPKTKEEIWHGRNRIKFEDFFFHQINLLKVKLDNYDNTPGPTFKSIGTLFNTYYKEILPFELTNAQKRVLKEIRKDVAHGKHMNRLLQGDVGSGKTMVALMTALMAIDNGYQVALMAPTEILANQHFENIKKELKKLPIKVGLLTGNIKGEERKSIVRALRSGHLHLLIGTHALIEDHVQFENLGIAIIDEQHRFGVAQRAKLWDKGKAYSPHILVMTATPIPRTLAMTNFGDLDVSIIDELPPGRKPIQTIHLTDERRVRMLGFMKEQIDLGRQVYVVYPLIEESEHLDLNDLYNGFNDLQHHFPYPHYRTSVVHGKMKPAEKEAEMKKFVEGNTHIMVATTVIEVGVNVPNASVMIIENAERFGLAQLHQLRGRVGRGADQSYCILMTKKNMSEYSYKRIQTMVKTNNGFEIAEADLQLRGPGEIEGTRQSGDIQFRMANVAKDGKIAKLARYAALNLLEKDRELTLPSHQSLRNYLLIHNNQNTIWSKIS